jgi:hypothetical protein
MSLLKVSHEKVGPSAIVNVFMEPGGPPAFPRTCPCCGELADEDSFIVARCDGLPAVLFPACADCAKHTEVNNGISGVMVPVIVGLTILSVVAFLFLRGVGNAQETAAGSGWQVFAGLSNLLFPFKGMINALVTVLGAGVVLVAYLFAYKGLMHLFFGHLNKESCKWFNQAARLEKSHTGADGKPRQRRFIFENPAYAAQFIKANGGEPADS